MDLKKYLEICQQCSLLPIEVAGRRIIPPKLMIVYKGIKYYPISYSLKFDGGNRVDVAFLQEIGSNSAREVLLKDIEVLTKDNL